MIKKLNKNVPQLRFPGFVGGWKTEKVGDICGCIVPGRNKPKLFNGDIPWVTVPDIKNEKINISSTSLRISYEEAESVGSKVIPRYSVLMSCAGELGITAITDCEIVINQQLHAFLPSDLINNFFLLHSIKFQKKYIDSVATKTAVPYLNKANCNSIPITFPSISEQEKIASFLRSIDSRLTQLRRKHELLQTYKRGVMQKIFAQELRFKDETGSDFPDWKEKNLKSIAAVNPTSDRFPDNFLYIDLECVNNGRLSEPKLMSKENSPSRAQRILRKGDILYQTVRPYQRNNLFFDFDGDYVASTGYAQLRAKQNKQFLYQLIHSDKFVNEVISRCTGTSYPAINSNDLANISSIFPISIEEQGKIADFLTAIDKKIEAVTQQIERTEEFKKGLLQKMFV